MSASDRSHISEFQLYDLAGLLSQCTGAPGGLGLAWYDAASMGPRSLILK